MDSEGFDGFAAFARCAHKFAVSGFCGSSFAFYLGRINYVVQMCVGTSEAQRESDTAFACAFGACIFAANSFYALAFVVDNGIISQTQAVGGYCGAVGLL